MTRGICGATLAALLMWAGLSQAEEGFTFFGRGESAGKIRQTSFGPELRQPSRDLAPPRMARNIDRPSLLLAPTLANAPGGAPLPAPGELPLAPAPAPTPIGPSPSEEFVYPIPEPVPMEGHSITLLYPHVRYKDLKNVPACAVPMIVAVRHPCDDCACAYVQICVPPNCCPKIDRKKNGYEVEYDYGDFEVEIKSKDGLITVDYDD